MTATELEASIREWQKTFEKMLMEMTSTTTEDGQAMFFDGIPLVMAFSVAVDGLKNDHNGGIGNDRARVHRFILQRGGVEP